MVLCAGRVASGMVGRHFKVAKNVSVPASRFQKLLESVMVVVALW